MLQLKRNDLLIGFTISVLLSIFVNFALLMRKYEFETGNPNMGIIIGKTRSTIFQDEKYKK